MSHVIFDSVTGKKIAINTAAWIAVGPASSNETSGIMLTRDVLIEVVGPMDEVLAALEAATAPPAPAPVVVEPGDLEIAAKVLDAVSRAIVDCDENDAVDDLASALFDVINMGGQTHIVLTALANRLRGGA